MFRRSSRSSSSYGLVLKMMNAVAYALFLGVHVGFTYGGLYNADSGKPTYVTPAPWAFLVWPIIHFLFLGTIIYQFTDKGHKVIIEGLSWWFMILMLLSALYAHLWASHEYLLAFIVSFLLVGFDSTSHDIIREQQDPSHASDLDQLFIHIPFSLYLGWIRVLNCLSGFAAFGVNAYTHPAGTGTKVCVVLALCHLHFAAASDALYSPAGSITILSYLWAVFVHQKPERSEFVHDVALVFAVLATIWVFMVVMIRMRRAERETQIDEERAPLLGGGYVVVKRRVGTLLHVVL